MCATLRDAQSAWHTEEVEGQQKLLEQKEVLVLENRQGCDALAATVAAAQTDVQKAATPHARQQALAKVAELEALLDKQQKVGAALQKDAEGVREKLQIKRDAQAGWLRSLRDASGATAFAPIFPVGDALLEPFWPQAAGRRGEGGAVRSAYHCTHARLTHYSCIISRAS